MDCCRIAAHICEMLMLREIDVEEKVMLVYMLCYWCKQYCKYDNVCGKET